MSLLDDGVPRDPDRFARFASASVAALIIASGLPIAGCGEPQRDADHFRLVSIDADGPRSPWGKAAGDINGDGLPDLVVGGHEPPPPVLWRRVLNTLKLYDYAWPTFGELVWYESPTWKKHLISNRYRVRTDIEVVDIDGDGLNDVVAVTDQGLIWFRNPDWTPTMIGNQTLHDLEVADLDGDGKLDVVARNQQLFNHKDGDKLHFYRQESPARWIHTELRVPAGEGLKVADLDGDGRPDVVVNQLWYRNPGTLADSATWRAVPYCSGWHWPHAYLDVADVNGDGRPDIVAAPAEPVGMRFRLSWCEAPQHAAGEWMEHVIDPDVETAMHSIVAGDFDGDGRIEIAAATMHHAHGAKDVAIYRRTAGTQAWTRTVIDNAGSHSMKALDFDQDGDLDLFGANLWGDDQTVKLWVNTTKRRTAPGWRRHIVDNGKPWRSVFVYAADLDGDGLKDLVTGGWWYKNPGTAGGLWERRDIGSGAYNVALVHDFDGDGAQDVLSSTWRDEYDWTLRERLLRKLGRRALEPAGGFVWARNNGHGSFEVLRNIAAGDGDFLQGVTLLANREGKRVVISWHEAGLGLQQLLVPDNPAREPWTIGQLSSTSQDEQLSAADVDGDGDLDLVLGTVWLRNEGRGNWTPFALREPPGKPDRHRVADLNGDGRLDVVVGFEAISVPGKVAWYEHSGDPTRPWVEHVIATLVGPMSLDIADIDRDGDLDIVVGEHNLRHPSTSRLVWLENVRGDASRWATHVIHVGDEHHDGALTVDIDNDGDLDIVSIGWGHDRLLIYENLSIDKHLPKGALQL